MILKTSTAMISTLTKGVSWVNMPSSLRMISSLPLSTAYGKSVSNKLGHMPPARHMISSVPLASAYGASVSFKLFQLQRTISTVPLGIARGDCSFYSLGIQVQKRTSSSVPLRTSAGRPIYYKLALQISKGNPRNFTIHSLFVVDHKGKSVKHVKNINNVVLKLKDFAKSLRDKLALYWKCNKGEDEKFLEGNWLKHGRYSKLDPEVYFNKAIVIYQKIALPDQSLGIPVGVQTASNVSDAVSQTLFRLLGVSVKPEVVCDFETKDGYKVLREIRIWFEAHSNNKPVDCLDKCNFVRCAPTDKVNFGVDPAANDAANSDPAADAPADSDPAADAPADSDPTADAPADSDPAADAPADSAPTADAPADSDPAADAPADSDPAADIDPAANAAADSVPVADAEVSGAVDGDAEADADVAGDALSDVAGNALSDAADDVDSNL